MYDLSVHLVTTTHSQQRYSRTLANNVDTDYDLTGPEQEDCVRGCVLFFL